MRDTAPPVAARALVIAQRLPHPVRGGGDLRVAQTIAAFSDVGVVGLSAAEAPAGPPAGVGLWRAAESAPATTRDEAAASVAWLRDADGHPSDRWWTPQAAALVEGALREMDPEVVVLEHLWVRRALDLVRGDGRAVVLNAHNAEARLHEELVDGAPRVLASRLAQRTEQIEAATVRAVDQVWATSEEDAREFRARYQGCAPVRLVPNGVEVGDAPDSALRPREPVLLFPGSFGYPPNAAAAAWLVREVLPAVRERLPAARLVLAGSGPPPSLRELAQASPGVSVTGSVEDMAVLFAAAAAVPVPLTAGGGTRFKVLEAFAAGAPVVSTPKGVEGIEARAGHEFLAAETAAEFAAAIVRLWEEPGLRDRLVGSARALVVERYSRRATTELIGAALSELV